MEQLNRHGSRQCIVHVSADRLGSEENENRPDTFATRRQGVVDWRIEGTRRAAGNGPPQLSFNQSLARRIYFPWRHAGITLIYEAGGIGAVP